MILFNFHYVDTPPFRNTDPLREHITITPEGLRRFIRLVRLLGYHIVSLKEAMSNMADASFVSHRKQMVLTFDDGYENFLTQAVPILEAEKCPATVFVLPGKLSGVNDWDFPNLPEAQQDKLLSLEQIKTLSQSPVVTIGSHGLLHRKMPMVSDEALEAELMESYHFLKQQAGEAFIPAFAYPWGEYDDRVLSAIAKTPYQLAVTTEKGHWQTNTHPHRVPRYSAFYRDGSTLVLLAKLLRNGLL